MRRFLHPLFSSPFVLTSLNWFVSSFSLDSLQFNICSFHFMKFNFYHRFYVVYTLWANKWFPQNVCSIATILPFKSSLEWRPNKPFASTMHHQYWWYWHKSKQKPVATSTFTRWHYLVWRLHWEWTRTHIFISHIYTTVSFKSKAKPEWSSLNVSHG